MKHRIAAIERRITPKNAETKALVAIIGDDGAIYADGHRYANKGIFNRFCAKSGIQTILFLPHNGRDKLTK
jgi:hypothetical protein